MRTGADLRSCRESVSFSKKALYFPAERYYDYGRRAYQEEEHSRKKSDEEKSRMPNGHREDRPGHRRWKRFGGNHPKTISERPLIGHGGLRYRQRKVAVFLSTGAATRVEPRSVNRDVPCNFKIAGDFFRSRRAGRRCGQACPDRGRPGGEGGRAGQTKGEDRKWKISKRNAESGKRLVLRER